MTEDFGHGAKVLKKVLQQFEDMTVEEYLDLYYREEPHKRLMHSSRRRVKYNRKALNKRRGMARYATQHTVASLPTVRAEKVISRTFVANIN